MANDGLLGPQLKKRYQVICAIKGIQVYQRQQIETSLRARVPSHTVVAEGDVDLGNYCRLHIHTDNEVELVNVLGKVLLDAEIDLSDKAVCRLHIRDIQPPLIPVPHAGNVDTERARTVVEALNKAADVFNEVLRKFPDQPSKWVPAVKTRLQTIACPHYEARMLVHAGMNIPKPDTLGLINMLEFAKLNRQLFPYLFDPRYARPKWMKRGKNSKRAG